MPYANENVLPLRISKTTQAGEAIIAAPGAGKRIAVDYVRITAGGGANTLTLTGSIAASFELASKQFLELSNDIHNPRGIFPCDDNQALRLTLSAATQVEGYILYRII